MEGEGKKKRKPPTPLFIAAAGNRRITRGFRGMAGLRAATNSVVAIVAVYLKHMEGYRIGRSCGSFAQVREETEETRLSSQMHSNTWWTRIMC